MNDDDQRNAVLVLDRADRDRTALKDAFRAAGVRYLSADDLAPGASLVEQLSDAIRAVRLVLIVIDDDPLPPSVLFEAGYARGIGAPIAVLDGRDPARHGTDELALDTLLPAPRLYAKLDDVAGLVEQLGAYLESDQHYVSHDYLKLSRAWPIGKEPVVNVEGSEIERRTANALRNAGATFVQDRPQTSSLAPDLVVQFPYLEKSMNPVLVEVKHSGADLERVSQQLIIAMTAGNVHLGLIVTLGDLEPTQYRTRGRVITQISLTDLEERPDHLRRFLTIARNLAVHGG